MQQHPMHLGGRRCALPPNPPPAFLFLRMTPLTATPLPRTARRNKNQKNRKHMELQGKRGQRWRKRQNSQENLATWKENTKKRRKTHGKPKKRKKFQKKTKRIPKLTSRPFFWLEFMVNVGRHLAKCKVMFSLSTLGFIKTTLGFVWVPLDSTRKKPVDSQAVCSSEKSDELMEGEKKQELFLGAERWRRYLKHGPLGCVVALRVETQAEFITID